MVEKVIEKRIKIIEKIKDKNESGDSGEMRGEEWWGGRLGYLYLKMNKIIYLFKFNQYR